MRPGAPAASDRSRADRVSWLTYRLVGSPGPAGATPRPAGRRAAATDPTRAAGTPDRCAGAGAPGRESSRASPRSPSPRARRLGVGSRGLGFLVDVVLGGVSLGEEIALPAGADLALGYGVTEESLEAPVPEPVVADLGAELALERPRQRGQVGRSVQRAPAVHQQRGRVGRLPGQVLGLVGGSSAPSVPTTASSSMRSSSVRRSSAMSSRIENRSAIRLLSTSTSGGSAPSLL